MRILKISLAVLALLLTLTACGDKAKTVTCDGCGAEITLEPGSGITDEWIVFCKTCEQEKFDGGVIGP